MKLAARPGGAGLWRRPDFLKLWAAQSVSSFGARITREGLAFAAVMSLGASPAQVGVLAALARGPAIVVGLLGGGLVDRGRRRPILIWTDVGRALVLASIPLAAWLHIFSMAQLYIVAAVVGGLSVLFDMADHAYLPFLIARADLVEGNAKLATTESIAEIGGPSLAGLLFQLLTAPFAIVVNAGTYLFSAAVLATIRAPEPAPAPSGEIPAHPITDFGIGLAAALAHPVVRPLLLITCVSALFGSFYSALYILFALRVLGLTPAMLGATISVGGVAALFGATLARSLIQRFGIGPTFVFTGAAGGLGSLFIPLAHGGPVIGMLMLMAAQLLGDSFGTVNEIAGRSLRQTQVPPELMGRVGGVFAAAPGLTGIIGAVVGGVLGGVLGPQHTLLIASAGVIAAPALGYFSPLRAHTETTVAEEG
ncbi:MAG TPA: MFS transporter [Caulobacteraceae bacterium]